MASSDGPSPLPDQLDAAVECHRRYLEQIVEVTNTVLRADSVGLRDAINGALAQVAALAGVDRATVTRLRGRDRMDNTHEWRSPGTPMMMAQLQDMSTDLLIPWRARLDAGETIALEDTATVPDELAAKKVMQAHGIRAMLVAPMLSAGTLTGFMALDVTSGPRKFHPLEQRLLQSLANAVGVVLDRAKAEVETQAVTRQLTIKRNRMQAILDALPYMVLEVDRNHFYVSHNLIDPESGFVPPHQFMGKRVDQVMPPEVDQRYREALARLDAGARSVGFEYSLLNDGAPRWRHCTVVPRQLEERRDGCILIIQDITDQHQREYQLARLSRVATLTSNLIIMTDAETRIEWVNPAFERRTGWRLEEIIGRKPREMLRSDKSDPLAIDKLELAVATGGQVQTEVMNRTRDGDEYWVAMDTQAIHDPSGEVLGYIAVQTEITSIMESHSRELHDSRMAIEGASDGVAVLSQEGDYRYMNRAYRAMFGVGADEPVSGLTWQALHPEADLPGPATVACRGQHRDGRPVPQEISATPREDGCLLVIAREITERTRLEAERAALRDELQMAQRQATIAHVAAHVAHDLNNVIAVVSGASSVLAARLADDAQAQASLGQIQRAADMAAALVKGITQLGKRHAASRSHDLRALVTQGVDLIGQPRIEAHGVRVLLPETPVPVWAEGTALLQVVVNLVLNACEADPQRPAQVTVSAGSGAGWQPVRPPDVCMHDPARAYALLTVSDTGPGVPPERLSEIFQPYRTSKGENGTGLGLPIVASILSEAGAALWFDSTPGQPTRVTVAWPVARLPAQPPMAGGRPRRMPEAAPQEAGCDPCIDPAALLGCNVLIVDDLEDMAEITSARLERAGAVTVSVTDPNEAAELLASDPAAWSALVTDHAMPGRSGTELAQLAATLVPPVPVLILTARPEQVRAQAIGDAVILSKPVQEAHLVRSVCELVAQARMRRTGG